MIFLIWLTGLIGFYLVVIARQSRRVQERIDARLAPLQAFKQSGVPPFRVKYQAVPRPNWIDVEKVKRLSSKLQQCGFIAQGNYENQSAGIILRVHYHSKHGMIGLVSEMVKPFHVFIHLGTRYQDGTEFNYSTAKSIGILDQPPFSTTIQGHPDDIPALIDEFLRERPKKPILQCQLEEIPALLEESYRRDWDWRFERGGLTEDEIRRVIEHNGGEATPEMTGKIRERYHVAIENFRREPPVEITESTGRTLVSEQPTSERPTSGATRMVQFTIREWALVCIIVGLTVGWGLDHWGTVMRERRAAASINERIAESMERFRHQRPPAPTTRIEVDQSDER